MVAKLPPGFVGAEGFDITPNSILFNKSWLHFTFSFVCFRQYNIIDIMHWTACVKVCYQHGMKLNEYRGRQGWSYSELARQGGAPHATVARRWCLPRGHKDRLIPNENYMDKIILLTNGEGMPNDFYVRHD